MTNSSWVDDLFIEKSLWQTFCTARKFPSSPFNKRVRRWIYPSLLTFILLISWNISDSSALSRGIDAASSALVSISATIIGFLVTGLAIFATLSDKKILSVLAQTPQKGTEVSAFKYLYFNLLHVFVVYISIMFTSVIIQTISKVNIVVSDIDILGIIYPISIMINGIILGFLLIILLESIVSLKTFIWNIYATFLSVLTVSTLLEGQAGTENN